jgi:hypothetical protein
MRLKAQGHLGEDALAKINPVRLVLGGGKHEFTQRQNGGIKVERPGLRVIVRGGKFGLERVRVKFDVGEAIGLNQIVKYQELLLQPGTHR